MVTSSTTIDDLGIDLVQNIFGRLPAVHFASADCVSRSWHHACRLILRRPKLSSACSSNPDLEVSPNLYSTRKLYSGAFGPKI
ncbi:putative F-box domain-containing protein [Helianthus debilis subsp. tardiflorus]